LVESFRATLEEAAEADLLIHVIDSAAPERAENIEQVKKVLTEIGADEIPTLEVYNKIDLLSEQLPRIDYNAYGRPERVWVSAKTGQGLEDLLDAISVSLSDKKLQGELVLEHKHGAFRGRLFKNDVVVNERYDDNGNAVLEVKIAAEELKRLAAGEYDLSSLSWWSDPNLES
jgi:GTP-binding protein HflX